MTHPILRLGQRGWPGHLVAAAAGPLITFSLAPYDLWPLSLLAVLLFALTVQTAPTRTAVLRGWLMAATMFLTGASWIYVSIHDHGNAPVWLASVLTGGFCLGLGLLGMLPAWIYARFFNRGFIGQTLGLAALWVLGEWFRSWFLTGFPWLYLGYSHTEHLLSGWAPLTGTFSISLIIATTATTLAYWLRVRLEGHSDKRAPLLIALLAVLWIAGPLLAKIEWTTPVNGKPIKVALIQANVEQQQKWSDATLVPTLRYYYETTSALVDDTDLIVWPETAIPRLYQRIVPFVGKIDQLAIKHNSAVLTGIPYGFENEYGPGYYNSIIAMGNASGIYHKRHMVPFGEYVPLESLLRGLIAFFDLPMSAFSRGPHEQPRIRVTTKASDEVLISSYLCYEVSYPDVAPYAMPDASLMLTASNDTWFGHSIGPLQHMQIAQMRALEAGRYMIRATNNGVTALVNAKGHIYASIPQFKREVLRGEVLAMQGQTPFTRIGDWPVLGLCVVMLIAAWVARRRTP